MSFFNHINNNLFELIPNSDDEDKFIVNIKNYFKFNIYCKLFITYILLLIIFILDILLINKLNK